MEWMKKCFSKESTQILEKAKEKGKGYYHFYCSGLDCEREQRFIIENQLHRAIEKNEFSSIINLKLILKRERWPVWKP